MQTHAPRRTTAAPPTTEPVAAEHALVDDADEWLDEIDAVLEDNALEFTRSYVQKGGQ